jgi:hypothetical protein
MLSRFKNAVLIFILNIEVNELKLKARSITPFLTSLRCNYNIGFTRPAVGARKQLIGWNITPPSFLSLLPGDSLLYLIDRKSSTTGAMPITTTALTQTRCISWCVRTILCESNDCILKR